MQIYGAGASPPSGDASVHPGFNQPEGLEVFTNQIQVLGAVIIEVKPRPLFVRVHDAYFKHLSPFITSNLFLLTENYAFPESFPSLSQKICSISEERPGICSPSFRVIRKL